MTAGPLVPGEFARVRLCRVAAGEEEADLAIRGGTVADVDSGRLLRRDVFVAGRYIAAVTRPGTLSARQSLDASGRFVLPAFVRVPAGAPAQVEPPLLTPGELARLVVPRGTVTVLTDPAEVVALCGRRGVGLATATRTPLRLLVAGQVKDRHVKEHQPEARQPDGRRAGRPEDHRAVHEVAPAGAGVPRASHTAAACTVVDVAAGGPAEADAVHAAVEAGMDPVAALRRATLVPARRHGLDHVLGSLASAHLADLLVVGGIGQADPPDLVVVGGRIAAKSGRPLFDNTDSVPDWARGTVHLPPGLHAGSFALPYTSWGRGRGSAGADMPVTEIVVPCDGEPWVRPVPVEPTTAGGVVIADPGRDLLKAAVIDRAGSAGVPSVGLVRGVGLRRGAVGVSARRTPGNLVVVGADDDDMLTAATALEGMGGGFVAVDRGWVRAACPLPVAGMMSDTPWEAVVAELEALDAALADLGCALPFLLPALAGLGDTLIVNYAQRADHEVSPARRDRDQAPS